MEGGRAMRPESIHKAIQLSRQIKYVLIATSNRRGLPHVAAAGSLQKAPGDRISVAEWFCPGTVANLQVNRQIAIIVWDRASDTGYQLLGKVEKVEETAVMNGFSPQDEGPSHLPQVQRNLIVQVKEMLAFSRRPHNDVET
ncbi:MAG TPA: pyridoxamine 5'-phosphate oxidase family protein [Desulfobacterales bacterium]|nr:pyridoxamine 5'-phosphate oxidase family protein [Desulfobacterales bacterium]